MRTQSIAAALIIMLSNLVTSCASTTAFEDTTGEKPIKMTLDEMRAVNKGRLQKVTLGMTKQNVLETMGTRTFYQRVPHRVISNPYRIESSPTKDGRSYEIVFYYTDIKKADDAITDDELTPLVFENGKLIGWGWSFVEDKTKKFRIEVR